MEGSKGQRSVLITAGAKGIGKAIASSFAQSGASVHVVDVDENALGKLPQGFLQTIADVADEASVCSAVRRHINAFGSIDVLINCAGIQGPTAGIEMISLAEWRRCLAVNLDAMYLTCREVVPFMKRQTSGNIINIASTAGWHGYPLRTPYATSKWGVIEHKIFGDGAWYSRYSMQCDLSW